MILHRELRAVFQSWFIVLDTIVVGFANVMDRAKIGRKIMLYTTLYLTVDSYYRGWQFINAHWEHPDFQTAAMMAAILAPLSFLQKAVFNAYNDSTANVMNDSPLPPKMPPEALPADGGFGPQPPSKGIMS